MFEISEIHVLAQQMNSGLQGKVIRSGSLGNTPHKFVWYNRTHEEFSQLVEGKQIGTAHPRGRWLLVDVNPGYVLVIGECGGKLLLHSAGTKIPGTYHLLLQFQDSSFLTITTQMWGAMELFENGEEEKRMYIQGMRPTPTEDSFTFDYFNQLLDHSLQGEKRSLKSLLTQDQLIPGLGNSIAQDILFNARMHPKRSLQNLNSDDRQILFDAICSTVQDAIKNGGRNDEFDLFGKPGGYIRQMDKNAAGKPCPRCGTTIEKIQYLGGSCYFCPGCQK